MYIQFVHKLLKSNLLPRKLPLLYTLLLLLKYRGAGKPDTGNVCTPAFGGGDGILRRPLADAKGARRLGGGRRELVLGSTLEGSGSGEYVRAAEGGLRPGGGGARTGDAVTVTFEDLGGGGGALSGVGLVDGTGIRKGTAAIERDMGETGLSLRITGSRRGG